FVDTTFTTGSGLAHLITPTNGATNVPLNQLFTWNTVSGAQAYYLYIGTTLGAKDVWSSGSTLATSATVPGLVNGKLYYARMWTQKGGAWFTVDTTFTTLPGPAQIIFPPNGATNVDTNLTATWTTVGNAQSYAITVGSALGGADIYSSGPL